MSDYYKLVVTGAVNAGKTTFVRTISEIDPITTDEMVTEESVKEIKSLTTVAMDYGRRTIDKNLVLHIYGTPGQERFYFSWDVLVEGAFGVIFLADSTSIESIKTTKNIIHYFRSHHHLPYLLCITKLDLDESLGYQEVMHLINEPDLFSIQCSANKPQDVYKALVTLLTLAIDSE